MQNSCNIIYRRNMVCFRYIIVNTLHIRDSKDDDDDDNNNNNNNKMKLIENADYANTLKRQWTALCQRARY